MAAFLFPELQFTDNTTGAPLAFGKVYTYVAGTSTPLETFTDHTGGISAGLYVVLDAQGRPNSGNGIWLGNTSFYKFIIKDANANTIQTVDYISPASLSVTGSLITVNAESQLLSSRQLTASQGVSLTDAGALSTLTIKADIPSLTADATPVGSTDYVMTYDASAALNKKVLIDNVPTNINGLSADATPVGSTDYLITYDASATANKKVLIDNFPVNINGLSADASPVSSTDYVMTYDASATANKKVLIDNILSSAVPKITINSQTGTTYTAVAGDHGKLITLTTQATHTLSLTAAATLGSGWYCYVTNANTGDLTVDPNGAETINGGTTLTVPIHSVIKIICTGATFYCLSGLFSITNIYSTGANSIFSMGTAQSNTLFTVASGLSMTSQSPAQITSDQNNYAITMSSGAIVRINSDAARDITGIVASTYSTLYLSNVGAFDITLKHQSGSSSAANRFKFPGAADFVLAVDTMVQLWYDVASTSWRRVD